MSTEEKRKCKGCGAALWFVLTNEGKIIPLDIKSPVYEVEEDMTGEKRATRRGTAYVTHFATCSKANDFSGSKRA
jgi:hypothetical protein